MQIHRLLAIQKGGKTNRLHEIFIFTTKTQGLLYPQRQQELNTNL
jgi:hypothetical protein